jgi:[ribosomal protein S5]-alanine N-acetyltransferase
MTKTFSPFPELHTERLILRELRVDDAPEILILRSDDRVNRYIDRPVAVTLDNATSFIDRIRHGIRTNHWLYWAVTPMISGKLIGTVSLWNFDDEERTGELGYELLPDYQGQGYMQEAVSEVLNYGFSVIGLDGIRALTRIENERSVRLLLKNGFIPHEDTKAEENESAYFLSRKRWAERR